MVRCRFIDCGNYDRYLSGPLRTYTQGLYAIILGHIIGGILLFGAGLIGGRLRQGSMNTTAFSWTIRAKGLCLFKYAPAHRLDQHHDLRCHVSLTSTGTSITYDLDHCHRGPRHLWLFIGLHIGLYSNASVSIYY